MKNCTTNDAEKLLAKWLVFSADVTPGDAMGAEWLASLREKTKQFINQNTSPEIVRKYQSDN